MAHDGYERGLFEDSEGSSAEEDIPPYLTTSEDAPIKAPLIPVPEVAENEVMQKSIAISACPVQDHHLVICKLPPTVFMAASPFNEMEERDMLRQNPTMLDDPDSSSNIAMIRWRFKPTEDGSSEPFGVLETNTHLVEWDDGTLTMFIGKTPLNVDCRSETVFLLEDSRADMKPVHAVITERLQTKFSNILKNKFTRSKELDAKRQKMTLTSIADAMSSQISLQQRRLLTRENERVRRIQQNSAYQPRGLTRHFLESGNDSP
ncbi:hypothetical protein X943_002391 [Babesia divergens]|uniref:Uncharacterized protein n=1 Tax=Babesia divergens TaxID=32595 RepID=A0AAD9G7A6_BABDI|nr:hypothetical protein X943_002391 [Babesia divergens]